jgi:hypothetical protein
MIGRAIVYRLRQASGQREINLLWHVNSPLSVLRAQLAMMPMAAERYKLGVSRASA